MLIMITIRINKHSRNLLKEYGATADISLNKLLDESDKIGQEEIDKTNIGIKEETFERLKEYKLSPHETHADTIYRLLMAQSSR